MKRVFNAIFVVALLLGATSTASALSLTVSSGLPATYIAQGSTVNGSFDINPSLAGSGFAAPYNVLNGTMTFNFADNYDTLQTGYSSSSSLEQVQACIGNWCYPTNQYRWVVSTTTSTYNPYESVEVSVAGTTSSGSTPYFYNSYSGPETASGYMAHSSLLGDYWVQNTHSVCTSWWGSTCYQYTSYPVYTVSNSINSGYTGSFSIAMALNNAAITDLSDTGVLGFSLTGTYGDLNFLSASLDLNVDGNADPAPAASASVPEPATILLLGSGMTGLVAMRRFRKM